MLQLSDWTASSSAPPLLSCLVRLPCYRTQCSWLPLPSAPHLVHLAGQVCQHKPHAALCGWPALSNNGCLCSTPAQCSRPTLLTHCGCATLQVCAVHVILGAPASSVQHEDLCYQAQVVLCMWHLHVLPVWPSRLVSLSSSSLFYLPTGAGPTCSVPPACVACLAFQTGQSVIQ